MRTANRPQPGQEDERDRVRHDRVGDREEADRTRAEHQRGHGDERIGGVEVAAEQEPRDERAEAAAAQSPLVQVQHVPRAPPAGGAEADHGDDDEEDEDDREYNGVDVAHRAASMSLPLTSVGGASLRWSRAAIQSAIA